MKMKRLLWGFLMIAAVALAGCGGNGGSSATDPMNGNGMNGNGMNGNDDATTVAQIRVDVTAALGDDATDDLVADVKTLIGQRDAEDPMVTAIRNAVTKVLGDDATDDLVADVMTLAAAYTAAADQAARDQMMRDSNLAQGLLAAMATQASTVTEVTATNTDGAVTVLVNPDATTNLSDFGPSTKDVAPDAAGFTKAIVEKAPDTDSFEIAAVYTDVQTDIPTSLLTDEGATDTNDFFTVAVTDFAMQATSTSFPDAPTTGETTVGLGTVVTIPGSTDTQLQFGGMWRGVPGTFICDACTATDQLQVTARFDSEGDMMQTFAFANSTDVWVFEPTDSNATVDVADADYLWFGWWQDMPTTPLGTGTQMFQTFAGGSQPYDTSDSGDQIELLVGDATYEGSAAGKYVQQAGTVFEPTYIADAFTATATLTAKFVDAANSGTIEGDINNFKNSAGQAMTGWAVNLEPITLTGDNATFTGGTAVATIGSISGNEGSWDGAFFGNGRNDGEPGSVAGEFSADFGATNSVHTSIAGAYGVHNTSPDTTN